MKLVINKNIVHFILFGALLLLYVCGFSFLQSYQVQALLLSTAILIVMLFYFNKMKIKKRNTLLFIFTVYVIIGIFVWGVEKNKISLIIYVCGLLTGVLYVLNDIPLNMTEKFFKIIEYIAIFEAITIFLSVAIPGLMPQKFGFLYRQLVIDTMNKELSRGIYSGFIGEKATAAYLLNLGLAYTLSQLNDYRQINKNKLLVSLVLLIAILFTGKRLLLLTAIIMFVICLLRGQSTEKKIKAVMIIIVSIIGIFCLVKFIPAAGITFDRFMLVDSYESMNGREDMWSKAIQIFENHKMLGCGYGSYQKISGSIYNAHNSYLQLLAEIGVVGCIMLGIIVVSTIYYALLNIRKKKNTMNYLAINLLIITLLYAYTGNVFHTANQLITFFIAISIVQNSDQINIE